MNVPWRTNLSIGYVDFMKELRRVDDNIINRLNSTSTQAEGVCGDFFKQMSDAYHKRDEAIDYCLKVRRIRGEGNKKVNVDITVILVNGRGSR